MSVDWVVMLRLRIHAIEREWHLAARFFSCIRLDTVTLDFEGLGFG